MNIDGVEYEPVNREGEVRQIVIAQRGFVYVGMVKIEGDEIVIRDGSNIRRWGTTRGLGELASDGPQSETKMDHCGTVRVHKMTSIARIDCEESAWQSK